MYNQEYTLLPIFEESENKYVISNKIEAEDSDYTLSAKERFLQKIEKDSETGCWNWKAPLRNGYGQFSFKGKSLRAHRVGYALFKGPIDENLYACHKCDNPKCVNPDHIFPGTAVENMKDCAKKGRNKPNPIRSIPIEKAKEIKDIIQNEYPSVTLKSIAKRFDIPYQLIRDIHNGRSYVNV